MSQVFQDVARYSINRDRCLDVLYLASNFEGQKFRLPSWTPAWCHRSVSDNEERLRVSRNLQRHGHRSVSAAFMWPEAPPPGDEDGLLNAYGTVLGPIKPCSALEPSRWRSRDSQIKRLLKKEAHSEVQDVLRHRLMAGWKILARGEHLGGPWIVPKGASEGDLFFHLYGSRLPIIMRRTNEKDRYKWIGPALSLSSLSGGFNFRLSL